MIKNETKKISPCRLLSAISYGMDCTISKKNTPKRGQRWLKNKIPGNKKILPRMGVSANKYRFLSYPFIVNYSISNMLFLKRSTGMIREYGQKDILSLQ